MRRASILAVLAIGAAPAAVHATDVMRPPQVLAIHARPGAPDELLMSTTFGPLFSTDGGDTWRWLCEEAVGYGGNFEPDYVVTAPGTALATTFSGVRILRDGCGFDPSALGPAFASNVARAGNGTIHVAMVSLGDSTVTPPLPPDHKLYRSTDDGVSFDAGLAAGTVGDEQWTSLEVAPSDPQRIYAAARRLADGTVSLYRSDDGGDSYAPLAVTAFAADLTDSSELLIAAIAPADPDRVLLRVTWSNPGGQVANAFWLTTNGGAGWTPVLEVDDNARAALFRANGDVLVGTQASGLYRSVNAGATFTPLPGVQPPVWCLHERPDGAVWACTKGFGEDPFDGAVLATTDLASWTTVMRFQDDIVGPVDCAAGTIQHDCCVYELPACEIANPSRWCRLAPQLQVVTDPIGCPLAPDAAMPPGDGGPSQPGTCCGAGAQPAGSGLLAAFVMLGLRRRLRSRRT